MGLRCETQLERDYTSASSSSLAQWTSDARPLPIQNDTGDEAAGVSDTRNYQDEQQKRKLRQPASNNQGRALRNGGRRIDGELNICM